MKFTWERLAKLSNQRDIIPVYAAIALVVVLSLVSSFFKSRAEVKALFDAKGNTIGDFIQVVGTPYILNFDWYALEEFEKTIHRDPDVQFVETIVKDKPNSPGAFGANHDEKPLTYERVIRDRDGRELGIFKIGYRRKVFEDHFLNSFLSTLFSVIFGIFLVSIAIFATLKKLSNRISQQEASLAASSKMASLGEMAGGLAHEVNNPLAIVLGRLKLLEKILDTGDYKVEDLRREINMARLTADRIAKIVRGLLIFARNIEGDKPVVVKISDVIQETLVFCAERFRSNGVTLNLGTLSDVSIACRPTQLSQAILNLLNNAFDAVQNLPERWVRLQAAVLETGKVQIEVVDSGGGIPDHIAEKMMQPFFTTKEIGKGTGLGLSITQSLIESNGGVLALDRKASNTRFTIELPIVATELQKAG